MNCFRFFLSFSLLFSLLKASASDEKSAEQPPGVSSEKIASELGNILSLIGKNYPLFFKKISSGKEDELLAGFVNSLGYGIKYGQEKKEAPATKISDKVYPAVNILSNKVSYVRLDALDDKQFKQFEDDLKTLNNHQNRKIGIIIDLRNCRGHDVKNVSAALSLLRPLGMDFHEKGKRGNEELPIIVLIGKNTEGDAEILASELFKSGKCLCIGTESAGKQFKTKKIKLEKGNFIEIPEIPAAFENVSIKPFAPSIELKGIQADYEKISKEKEGEKADPCISCASDLLTGLSVLGKR